MSLEQLQEEARLRHLSPQMYFDMVMSKKISRNNAERVLQRGIKLRNKEIERDREQQAKRNRKKYISSQRITVYAKPEKKQRITERVVLPKHIPRIEEEQKTLTRPPAVYTNRNAIDYYVD